MDNSKNTSKDALAAMEKKKKDEADLEEKYAKSLTQLKPLEAFKAAPLNSAVKSAKLVAKFRVITLSSAAFLLILLDHNYELKDALVYNEPFTKKDGSEARLSFQFTWLFYTVSVFELIFVMTCLMPSNTV